MLKLSYTLAPHALAALLCAATLAAVSHAQQPTIIQPGPSPQAAGQPLGQPGQPHTSNFRGESAMGGDTQVVSNLVAAKLKLANECEVAQAKMGADRAKSDEVREFASMLKRDHEECIQKLEKAMPGLSQVQKASFAGDGRSDSDRSDSNQAGSNRTGNTPGQPGLSGQPGQGGQQAFLTGAARPLYELTRRAAEIHHQAGEEMLGQKDGAEFDRCFMQAQIGGHMWMQSELKALQDQPNLSPQLADIAREAEQKVSQHLEKAKQIAKSLEERERNSDRDS